jgi:hypothetical protein
LELRFDRIWPVPIARTIDRKIYQEGFRSVLSENSLSEILIVCNDYYSYA